jgi:hypothetical protein
MAEKVKVSLDIEAISNTDVVGIGLVAGNDQGKTLFKKRWWIEQGEKQIEPRCKREFWDKFTGPYNDWQANGKNEEEQIQDFVATYDNLPKRLKVEEKDIELVNDNAEYDFGRLAPYVKKYCNRDPLRYTSDGSYRSINDVGDTLWSLGIYQIVDAPVTEIQAHDHFPDNDAEHNMLLDVVANRVFKRLRAELGTEIQRIAQEETNAAIVEIKTARSAQEQQQEEGLPVADNKCVE